MTPDEITKLLTGLSQYGVLGLVTFFLGKRFLQSADEDRKWIREAGEKQMVMLADMLAASRALVDTNKAVIESNTKLVAILEKMK